MTIRLVLLLSTLALAQSEYVGGAPHSTVVDLKQDSFEQAIKDPANGLWLLKFYAPWCGHCKKMAPVLDAVAPMVKGRLAIGKIDCTTEKSICNDIRGYPTLKFARDGEIHDYPAGRTEDDIIGFAKKMSSPPFEKIQSYQQAISEVASESSEGVAFVAYHPSVVGDKIREQLQATHLTQVFAQVARKYQASAYFAVLTSDDDVASFNAPGAAETGFIVKIDKHAAPQLFVPSNADFPTEEFQTFVQEGNFALVTKLGPSNFRKVGNNGRPLVIGVTDTTNEQQLNDMEKDLADFALTGPSNVATKYYFATIDGKKWAKFLKQFGVESNEVPQIIIVDVPTKKYWQDASFKTTKEFIEAVTDGRIEGKKSSSSKDNTMMGKIGNFMQKQSPYTLITVALLFVIALYALIRPPSRDDLRPPYKQSTQKLSPPTETKPNTEPKKEK